MDEAAVHLQVGEHGEVGCGLGVGQAGLQLLDDGMATGDGCDHLVERVGLGARGEVFAQQEGNLRLQHAIAEARARQQCAAAGHPGQGHGREEGRGVGRAGTDLPAADRPERGGHDAVDDGSLFQRLWLEFEPAGRRWWCGCGVRSAAGWRLRRSCCMRSWVMVVPVSLKRAAVS